MINKKQTAIITIMVLFIAGTVRGKTIEADWLVTQIKELVKIEKTNK